MGQWTGNDFIFIRYLLVYTTVYTLYKDLNRVRCANCDKCPTCSFTFTFMSLTHTHMMSRLESMFVALQWGGCHYHVLLFSAIAPIYYTLPIRQHLISLSIIKKKKKILFHCHYQHFKSGEYQDFSQSITHLNKY